MQTFDMVLCTMIDFKINNIRKVILLDIDFFHPFRRISFSNFLKLIPKWKRDLERKVNFFLAFIDNNNSIKNENN